MIRFLTAPSKAGLFIFLFILSVIAFGVPCSSQGSESASAESAKETRDQLDTAIRWLLRLAPRAPLLRNEEARSERIEQIVEFSEKYDHDPFLITSMMYCESAFRSNVTGAIGEIGLMQVHGEVVRRCIQKGFNLKTARGQIECGAWWLKNRTDHCGSVRGGLNAYATGRCYIGRKSKAWDVVERRFQIAAKIKGVKYEREEGDS